MKQVVVKHYAKAFQEQTVKLSKQRVNISAVARELGISSSQLSKWCRELSKYGQKSFAGRGVERLTTEEQEIVDLRKQLKESELDVEILKKAIAFFF